MRIAVAVFTAGLVLMPACALAQAAGDAAAPADATAPAAAPSPDDEIVCRTEPPVIGSRLGHRKVCKTRADWNAASRTSVTDNPALSVHAPSSPAPTRN